MGTPRRRVVVVGSGLAGLVVALETAQHHDVLLASKAELAHSTTWYAQGGIAAVLPDAPAYGDSVDAHVADTLAAGAGLSRRKAVEVLCAAAADRVGDLARWGVAFDRDHRGLEGPLARGLEGAHSAARILHAGGDATGATVQAALLAQLRGTPVTVAENTFVRDLLIRDGAVCGVSCFDQNGRVVEHAADAVVLATGGSGQLYPHTTNPPVATGDGLAAALRAGALAADLEMYQFHPTALAAGTPGLVSEAVRGEGAVLRDADGRRFMTDVHPDAELAPRDVVARAIATQMASQAGKPVLLDATGLGADFLRQRFPTIHALCRANDLDWTRHPIPVTPAAHYQMGGVRTDLSGRTSLPGLYAVGEVACTGVHGANRLASNSLLEASVFAHRCAQALGGDADADGAGESWATMPAVHPVPEGDRSAPAAEPVATVGRQQLQRLMWQAAGLFRTADGLRTAASAVASWRPPDGDTLRGCEDANLLSAARAVIAAALAREESRGAHFRTDHQHVSPGPARHSVLVQQAAPRPKEAVAC